MTNFVHWVQTLLLRASYAICQISISRTPKNSWLIGVSGVCGLVGEFAGRFESFSVCLEKDPYFPQYRFNFCLNGRKFYRLRRIILGPIVLGYFLRRVNGVFYVSDVGFLISPIDANQFEYSFIKSKGKHLVLWYTGSDIRSIRQSIIANEGEFEDYGSVIPLSDPKTISDAYDQKIKVKVQVAEKYGDLIFNHNKDQVSYFERQVYDTFAIVQEDFFNFSIDKFNNLPDSKIRIFHAATNSLIKGTPLIREAIELLAREGYQFEYRELKPGTSREGLLEELKSAHIVINQLYSRIPGHFGFEAMANSCAVIQSADCPKDYFYGVPWIETHSNEIYENLKALLENPARLPILAKAGYAYAVQYAHPVSVSNFVQQILKDEGLEIKLIQNSHALPWQLSE